MHYFSFAAFQMSLIMLFGEVPPIKAVLARRQLLLRYRFTSFMTVFTGPGRLVASTLTSSFFWWSPASNALVANGSIFPEYSTMAFSAQKKSTTILDFDSIMMKQGKVGKLSY
jgi:hypothetical protein